MKNNTAVRNLLRTSHDVNAKPKLIAEWNMNRYAAPIVINNVDEDEFGKDPDIFPIESIVEPLRPSRKGIVKAVVTQSAVSDPYWDENSPRFYLASEDDQYKYWMSPRPSEGSGAVGWCFPTLAYSRPIQSNKIVVHVENSWATPTRMTVEYSGDGGNSWTMAALNPAVPASGRIELYHNGNGQWLQDRPNMPISTTITHIRVNVTALGPGVRPDGNYTAIRTPSAGEYTPIGAYTNVSIIEIGARLEIDLTDRVISVSDSQNAGEFNMINPVGTVSSNTADITLWNGDSVFSENATESLHGIDMTRLIEPNVEMRLDYVYEDIQTVQQFVMFVDSWNQMDDGTVSVQLSDGSKYLKEIKPPAMKLENMTFAQIIYRVCDSVGFTNYRIGDHRTRSTDYEIPVFWTDGERTVWEILDELATATQSIVYFDETGTMNVKTRDDAFWSGSTPVWTLRGVSQGNELADIVSLEKETEYEANVVKVIYKTAKWAEEVNGFVQHSTVWEPDGTVVLRSSPLAYRMSATDGYFFIGSAEAAIWPYEGYAAIEDEIVQFHGKSFWYWHNGVWNNVHVKSQDDYDMYNKLTNGNRRHLNYFDGHIVIVERGAWDTVPTSHENTPLPYNVRRAGKGSVTQTLSGFVHNKTASTLSLKAKMSNEEFLLATKGAVQDTPWRHMGTKFCFDDDTPNGSRGGIVFNNYNGRDGYYVEICTSLSIPGKEEKSRNELAVYSIHADNGQRPINGSGKGSEVSIVAGKWYTLDIFFDPGSHRIKVYIDGVMHMNTVMPAGMRHTPNGKFGMFVRGDTRMQFDYLYAVARANAPEPDDEFSSFHRLSGDTMGRAKEDWLYKPRDGKRTVRRKGKKKTYKKWKKNQQFMDEFGPYVHEIREFDVKFDPAPVAYSFLYNANDWDAYPIDYIGNSFGASFAIANTSRKHATLNGDDETYVTGSGDSVSAVLMVFGRALVFEEEQEVVAEDYAAKRARGEIVTEIDSPWIQSKAAAQAVADWIVKHWGRPTDEVTAEVFGNTLFQIGDLVSVDYPRDNMSPTTHTYFITGINTSFDSGLSTTLSLRRRN